MSLDYRPVSPRLRSTLIGVGVAALLASLVGMVVGLILVDSVSGDLDGSVGLSESALQSVDETLDLLEGVAAEVDDGLATAADSIEGAAVGVDTAAGRLEDVADFLDGELQANIEAIHGSMPAAIQAASAIDATLRALSLLGVDYDPEEPFDVSLMAVEAALADLPGQLGAQADAIRALVPVSREFAGDAATMAESFSSLAVELATSKELIVSYRATLAQAEGVVDQTGSSLTANIWLIRLMIVMMALTGSGLAVGMIVLGRELGAVPEVVLVDAEAGIVD
ncbi:MAG TPA: hypothetical protein VF083_06860 [Acidimicrobiia bacterium]